MDDQIKYRRSQTLENPTQHQISVQIKHQYSHTSRKKIGSILVRNKNDQNIDEQPTYIKQIGKIKRASHSTNRAYTQPVDSQQLGQSHYRNKLIKMKSDIKKINQIGLGNKLSQKGVHSRTKSYQEQRLELQQQLKNVLSKRNRLEQLQTKKINLRAKLTQLQFKLNEIKDVNQINNISVKLKSKNKYGQNPFLQKNHETNTTKNLKKSKLKPLPLSLRKPVDLKIKLNTEIGLQNAEQISPEDAQDYYYQAQLQHKCLNCKHFALKVEDVGLTNDRIDQIIQTIKQSP